MSRAITSRLLERLHNLKTFQDFSPGPREALRTNKVGNNIILGGGVVEALSS